MQEIIRLFSIVLHPVRSLPAPLLSGLGEGAGDEDIDAFTQTIDTIPA